MNRRATPTRATLTCVARRMVPLTMVLSMAGTGLFGPSPAQRVKPVLESKVKQLADKVVGPGFVRQLVPELPTQMVGFEWDGRRDGTLEVRVRTDRGWGPWTRVEGDPNEGADPGSREYRGKTTAGPVWVGAGVREIGVRVVEGDLPKLKLHAIRSEVPAGGVRSAGAAVPPPPIITRQQWGADESFRTRAPGCNGQPEYASTVRYAVIHHTVTANAYSPEESHAAIRGIYHFHTHTSGFCDIGYNFIVDRYGQVFEGRYGGTGSAVVGAHASGFNRESTGVAALGTFTSEPVPAVLFSGLRNLLTWKFERHGINAQSTVRVGDRSVAAISGHRDLNPTECPGDALYSMLGRLRAEVAQGIQALPARPAVQRGSTFYLRDAQTSGPAHGSFVYGNPGDIPMFCDWNGDGRRTVGVYRDTRFYLRNNNTSGPADATFTYGNQGDQPVCGDWNGDGVDTVGVVRGGTWYLRNANSSGNGDLAFSFGNAGDRAVVGDWNGNRVDTPGVVRGGTWYLRNSNTSGPGDVHLAYGNAGDRPVVGDWNGDRVDTPGVVRGGTWYLRYANSSGPGDVVFLFGNPSDVAVVWN